MKTKNNMFLICIMFLILFLGIIFGGIIQENFRIKYRINIYRIFSFSNSEPFGEWGNSRTTGGGVSKKINLQNEINKLESIGYLSGSQAPSANENIIFYNKEKSYNGLNLWTSGHAPVAYLMDMNGKLLHTWMLNITDVWSRFKLLKGLGADEYFRRVHLFENGDLLVIFEGKGIVKINKDSKVIWEKQNGAHHDLFVNDSGQIYLLTRKAHIVEKVRSDMPILEDFITVLDENGNEIKKVSILKMFYNSDYASLLKSFRINERANRDIFHTNTIEMLDGAFSNKANWLQKGNVLLSILGMSMLCVVNLEQEKVVWAQTGFWYAQHEPVLLDNGNMLLFDNQGISKDNARVVEYNPFTLSVEWSYAGTKDIPLHSWKLGSSARLKNGNTLISETIHGRVLELTSDKKIVWEFINPNKAGENEEFVAYIPELIRLDPDFPTDWL